MAAYKGFKFRLYPTKEQAERINKTLGCCRYVYNHMLERRIKAYSKILDLPCVRMHPRQGYQCSKQYSEERSRSAGYASCFVTTEILVRPGWPEPNVCGECDLC